MISIRKVRIANFKSIKYIELNVDKDKSVFVGQNNAGKSNIIKAIDVSFNFRYVPSDYDLYSDLGVQEKCYIDVMLSTDKNDKNFDTDWLMIFGDKVTRNEFGEESFTIRTLIYKNEKSSRLEVDRFPILDWNSQEFESNNKSLSREVRRCIGCFYLSSDRDINDELRIRSSNFSKLIKNLDFEVSTENTKGIEKALEIVNRMIVRKMPSIAEIESNLSDISTTVNNVDYLRILPIPNRFEDLDKGVEIQVNSKSRELPVAVYGDGTRSWISILSLSTYIKLLKKQYFAEGLPFFAIVLLEEPESHLHPQAQNKVISQLDKIDAQMFITTHSSNIVSELGVFQLFRVGNNGYTQLLTQKVSLSEEDRLKFVNFIMPFYSEILFSEKVILVEGVTDKVIVSEYIKSLLRKKLFEIGVSIVGVGGKDNFPLFRQFCELHSIKNFIYADNDANPSLLSSIQARNLSLNDVVFTKEMNLELELLNDQFNACKEIFINQNGYSIQYIAVLETNGTLNEKILNFLKDNKTQYPHWISTYIDSNFKVNSIDTLLKAIGKN